MFVKNLSYRLFGPQSLYPMTINLKKDGASTNIELVASGSCSDTRFNINFADNGGNYDDFCDVMDDNPVIKPFAGAFSEFIGQDPSGSWTLQFQSTAGFTVFEATLVTCLNGQFTSTMARSELNLPGFSIENGVARLTKNVFDFAGQMKTVTIVSSNSVPCK